MRTKLILAAAIAAVVMPGLASAQSAGEVRRDRREVRQDRREVHGDVRRGDYGEARRDRRDLREDRADARGDWRDYRRTHRDAFRGPAYVGPRGYRYRPVAVGYRFAPVYYGRSYWIDPVRYHLAPAPRAARWVRYGNDVALVNLRTGRVIEVQNSFFW